MDHEGFVLPLSGFGPGALVATTEGELPVEWLERGDMVLTRDRGAQPIVKMVRTRIAGPQQRALPAPLLIRPAHAPGFEPLTDPLRLSPFTRVLVRAPQLSLHFGPDEAIAPIGDLSRRSVPRPEDPRPSMIYHHIIMARHELVWASGIWVESTPPETAVLLDVSAEVRAASSVFDGLRDAPRMCLTPQEAQLLRKMLAPQQGLHDLIAA